jgi:hypothetical protein
MSNFVLTTLWESNLAIVVHRMTTTYHFWSSPNMVELVNLGVTHHKDPWTRSNWAEANKKSREIFDWTYSRNGTVCTTLDSFCQAQLKLQKSFSDVYMGETWACLSPTYHQNDMHKGLPIPCATSLRQRCSTIFAGLPKAAADESFDIYLVKSRIEMTPSGFFPW